ncbi:MAG: secretion activator protein [Pseudomonadales bacterium]|nr:secretion activator protein [Pseudomonadales bacterium]
MSDFPQSQVTEWLERILDSEGGFTLGAADPGNWTGGDIGVGQLRGTKYGISAAQYPHLTIADLDITDAVHIYREDYLKPIGAGRFRDGVAFQLFDLAVNSGPGRAIKLLQSAIGVSADGVVGPITLKKLSSIDESDVIMLVLAARIDFMRGLSSWTVHSRGWMGRIADNLRYGALDS